MFKLAGAVLATLLLSACVSTQAIHPRAEIIDKPVLNTEVTAELGETVVEKGRLRTFAGLILSNELQWGDGFLLTRYNVPPGRLRARQQDAKFVYFFSDDMTSHDAILGTSPYPGGGLCRALDGSGPVRGFNMAGRCNMNWNVAPDVEDTRIYDVDRPGFRQELIYNGRSGETLKFLYREFSGDFMRPPFSQELQYDLRESMTIGFRGVRIEVIEASNTSIRYRVASSFPDPVL